MEEKELIAWLTLSLCPRIGPVTFQKILEVDTPEQFLSYSRDELSQLGLTEKQLHFIFQQSHPSVDACLEWRQKGNNSILLASSDDYPDILRQTKGYPPILFATGKVAILNEPQIAIVGSRNAQPQSLELAKHYAASFCQQGYVVTSGLALGVDGYAHHGALESGGKTIAVLGAGIEKLYPRRHRHLANRIIDDGVLVSEHAPFISPRAEYFPRRNRIISGLSIATLVVEAAEKSGSLITAKLAAEQGREVFAIPGSVFHPFHTGCHQLIKLGAGLVESPEDVLSAIQITQCCRKNRQNPPEKAVIEKQQLPFPELLANVGLEATPIDLLAQKTHIPVQEVMQQMLELELLGHVVSVTGGYILKGRG
ncbi:DNA-processing protein DprA [Vibrio hippocampi]|uniref:DNA-protecting protein DprA n=1 Tax=Vibrio hippocampi TaxID=654686 RepID=A0ABM8ZED4_9VIBR|nr:DNA-processing protein DprA [Vibrio hippocampi]CAH0524247.1 hypothetical protein VHP8226_00049 [Vibrio hippocampi]